jgi:tetratricopeptide (TPR) repeat protein
VQTGRFDDAYAVSKKAIELAPESASAVMNYGLSELWRGEPQRAVPFLEGLLKSTPDYPPAIGLLAVASLASGQADAARSLFEQLTIKGFLCEPYLLSHANKLIAADMVDRAAAILEAAITSGLGSPDLRHVLSGCRERSLNREEPVRPA